MNDRKTVYTNANVKELIAKGITEFPLDENIILTPSAADILREHGVRLLPIGECSSECVARVENGVSAVKNVSSSNDVQKDSEEETVKMLINILKNKFNITEQSVIERVIVAVLKVMKEMK